jgi:hypothetical protein
LLPSILLAFACGTRVGADSDTGGGSIVVDAGLREG